MEYAKGKEFVADFVARTRYNLEVIENDPNNRQYEVTQLVNSMVGLLIVPETMGYDLIFRVSSSFFEEICSRVDSNYKNDEGCIEEKNLTNTVRHMRNAVAHKRIEFIPDKTMGTVGMRNISAIKFSDRKKSKTGERYRFQLTLSIEELRYFLFEFSDAISRELQGKK